MRPLPSWSLSEPFCSTSWSMAVYSSSSTHVLLLAVFKQWSLIPSFWLVWHISMLLSGSILQSKAHVWGVEVLVCEDLRYLLKYGCEGNTLLWRSIFYIDKFKSCTLWWHLSFRTLDVSISCLCLSLVLSINSPNATTLHSRCIWEGVLRVL